MFLEILVYDLALKEFIMYSKICKGVLNLYRPLVLQDLIVAYRVPVPMLLF